MLPRVWKKKKNQKFQVNWNPKLTFFVCWFVFQWKNPTDASPFGWSTGLEPKLCASVLDIGTQNGKHHQKRQIADESVFLVWQNKSTFIKFQGSIYETRDTSLENNSTEKAKSWWCSKDNKVVMKHFHESKRILFAEKSAKVRKARIKHLWADESFCASTLAAYAFVRTLHSASVSDTSGHISFKMLPLSGGPVPRHTKSWNQKGLTPGWRECHCFPRLQKSPLVSFVCSFFVSIISW